MHPKLIIVTAICLIASMRVWSQKITFSGTQVTLQQIIQEVKKQTGYYTIYEAALLRQTRPVTIKATGMSLTTFLEKVLKDQAIGFSIQGNTIFLVKKMPASGQSLEMPPPIIVSGRVTNEKGEPVAGASVSVKGSQKGTTTNADGFFEIAGVEEAATLLITGANIETQEIKPAGRTSLAITARTKVTEEEEVVVNAGYYDVKKKEATGSISRVDSKVIQQQPVTNPLAAAAGRMPGVNIQQTTGVPGGDFKIEIRGRNSLRKIDDDNTLGNDPLYVVDGFLLVWKRFLHGLRVDNY